jgi:hypothetical protein
MSTAEDLVAATRCTDNHEVHRIPVELDAESTLAFQDARGSERWPLVAIRPTEIQRMVLRGATELIAPAPASVCTTIPSTERMLFTTDQR